MTVRENYQRGTSSETPLAAQNESNQINFTHEILKALAGLSMSRITHSQVVNSCHALKSVSAFEYLLTSRNMCTLAGCVTDFRMRY